MYQTHFVDTISTLVEKYKCNVPCSDATDRLLMPVLCIFHTGDYLLLKFGLNDTASGVLLLLVSLLMLCGCLVLLVKLLNSVLKGKIAKFIRKFINSDLPGHCSYVTGYLAIILGACLTILVQSSSVFTSAMTPLVGIGVIRIERMYPLTLGSNIGTTATGVLAALAAPGDKLSAALQIALVHLFFNITGILIFYPIPSMRWPIGMAKKLGEITATYRWFAVFYLLVMFFCVPALVFGLSFLHIIAFIVVISFLLAIAVCPLLFYIIVSKLQKKCPERLPRRLRTWGTVPVWQRLFGPLDHLLNIVPAVIKKLFPCCKCRVKKQSKDANNFLLKNRRIYNPSPRPDVNAFSEVAKTGHNEICGPDSGFCTSENTPMASSLPSRNVSHISLAEKYEPLYM